MFEDNQRLERKETGKEQPGPGEEIGKKKKLHGT
jgi:hypothetical protein